VAQDFYSFEKALRELHIEEEELKRLVSEGEIRAFRDQEKMKFKKEDIDRFKRDHTGEKDVIEALDAAQTGSRDVPTVNASAELPEELVFDEDDAASQQVGMETAAIADDSFLAEEQTTTKSVEKTTTRSRRPAPAARPAARVRTVTTIETGGEPGWMKALLIATALVLFLGAMAAYDASQHKASPMTDWLANMFKSTGTK
jgi:hypothetical protein